MKRSFLAAVTLLGACGGSDSSNPMEMDAAVDVAAEADMEAPNHPPIAGDDEAQAYAGRAIVIEVLENDGDADGDDLDVVSATQGEHGLVEALPSTVRYTPNDNVYVGPDSFTYTIDDDQGGFDEATVSVTIVEAPTLVITSPADNAIISGTDTMTVEFAVTGCIFSQPPNNPVDGCHAHKFLDGNGYPPTGGIGIYAVMPFDVTGLTVGPHVFRLSLALNDGSDMLWSPPIEDEINFTVE